MGAKIKKGDLAQVIAGRKDDKGKQGRVLSIDIRRERVIVEGVRLMTKHVKPGRSAQGATTGGIETIEGPIHISNVALVHPKTKKPTRVGFREEEVERDGRMRTVRVRVTRGGKEPGREI